MTPQLAAALVAAQAELPTAIERDAQGAGYRYTSLDKLIAATRPIMTKHGLAITQCPTTIERRDADGKIALVPGLATTLACEDDDGDQGFEFVCPLYLNDKNMQGLGAAITYARRYAWAAVLGIASEEDTDGATLDDNIPF